MKKYKFFGFFFFALFITIFAFGMPVASVVFAQSSTDVLAQKAKLEAELAELEQQILQKEADLTNQQGQSKSIGRDISILATKIAKAKLDIKAKNLFISKLSDEIVTKQNVISDLSLTIEKEKESLGYLIRKTNEIDNATFVHLLLGNKSVSEYYADVNEFHSIKSAARDSVEKITGDKIVTEKEKGDLSDKKTEELGAKLAIEENKKQVELNESEKKALLAQSKSKEKSIEQIKKDLDKKRASIRAQLFSLRDTAAIPFGKAYDYALIAEKATGVDPAFLLAIATQETNLGQNLGSCNKADGPESKKWKAILPGPEDIAKGLTKRDDESAYLRITSALGLDPNTLPLSCPFGVGWGGAMGPSQFIPTTWESMSKRVAAELGISGMPNPWDPKHAFMASATYLGDLGASSRTYDGEKTAALKYYSGSAWKKAANQFYGNQVMAKKKIIQETMIDPLQNN